MRAFSAIDAGIARRKSLDRSAGFVEILERDLFVGVQPGVHLRFERRIQVRSRGAVARIQLETMAVLGNRLIEPSGEL